MRIHGLFHAPFEGLGNIAAWAQARGHELSHSDLFAGEPCPKPAAYDFLVVMGGPMNIYEYDAYPWLKAEKAALALAVDSGRPVLGVCLGAQLLADALGGPVAKGKDKEIGWFDVAMTGEGLTTQAFRGFPQTFPAFHWHGDTFAIPPGAVRACASTACANQAFVFRERVVGLQFHLETSPESLGEIGEHCAAELVDGPYIQTLTQMTAVPGRFADLKILLDTLLDNLAAMAK
ncbi:MAG: type 1 glutamine amidotransferase [Desulfovibrionaceae bacterium]|nr:type 1 glutamine amidotransferase [Desulfovibrionaceae bacterium]MBF0514401.1 type 1 glutamine amidotransferase [Desulfovibrionaceae bacterium]